MSEDSTGLMGAEPVYTQAREAGIQANKLFVSLVHYLYKQYRENCEVPLSFKKVTKLFTYGWKAVSAWRDTSTAEGRQACDQLEAVGKRSRIGG